MARPYSLDLRERVVAQVSGGMSCHEAAELNNIVPSTVVKWTQRQRQTGSPAAKPMGGKRPYLLEEQRDWLLARIREKPDLTLHALLEELAQPAPSSGSCRPTRPISIRSRRSSTNSKRCCEKPRSGPSTPSGS